eukprot:403356734
MTKQNPELTELLIQKRKNSESDLLTFQSSKLTQESDSLSSESKDTMLSHKVETNQVKKRTFFAFFLMFMYVILTCLADSVSKLIYLKHKELSVYEFLFIRSFVQISFMMSLVNKNAYEILIGNLKRDMILPLCIRVFAGVISFFFINTAIQNLPIFIVSLVINLAPIFTSILAFIFLKERITRTEVFALILAFAGVYILVSSSQGNSPSQNNSANEVQSEQQIVEQSQSNLKLIPLILLVCAAMLMATTNIMLRHMKKMHEYCSATYAVLASIFFFGLGMPVSGSAWTIAQTFESSDYIILVFVAVCGIAGLICKTKAMQYEMASRLSIVIYFSVIFSLVFDLILIGTVFNSNEMYGMIVIFLANAISVYVIFSKFYKSGKSTPALANLQNEQASQSSYHLLQEDDDNFNGKTRKLSRV